MLPQPIKVFFGLRLGKQWGFVTTSGAGYQWVTFPCTFTTPYSALVSYKMDGDVSDSRGLYGLAKNGMNVMKDGNQGTYWFAVGK